MSNACYGAVLKCPFRCETVSQTHYLSAIVKLPVADSNEFAFSPLNSAKTDLEAYTLCQQMEN